MIESLSTKTVKDYIDRSQKTSPWDNSSHSFLKRLSSRGIGAFGEKFVAEIFEIRTSGSCLSLGKAKKDLRTKSVVDHYRNGAADLVYVLPNGKVITTEVKLGTRDTTTQKFRVAQQVRPDPYDVLTLVEFTPETYSIKIITKEVINKYVIGNDKYRQHQGKNGNQEEYWIWSTDTEVMEHAVEFEDWLNQTYTI